MRALDRKLFRDAVHLKGQLLAVALVVACGIASWVTMRSAHASLVQSQRRYYAEYRYAEIFASMRRAPQTLVSRVEAIPGAVSVQHRIVRDITLDVPGLAQPATGRAVSIPEVRRPMLNDLHLTSGRWIEPNRPDEVIISDAFASANALRLGGELGAVVNGRWRTLSIVGTALSPEYIYEIRPGDLLPDKRRFGVVWMSREALEAAFDMEGAFNDLALTIAHGTNPKDVIARIDTLITPWGGAGAYDREEHVSHRFISDEIQALAVGAAITPAIFLSVAAFLIHLVLSRLVQLQRDQIAILKAFGYESRTIGLHYMEMAMLTIGSGGIAGILLGLWLGSNMTALYQTLYNLPLLRYEAPLSLFATSVGISALAAILGARSSVRSAIALPPAEAMRPEAPARFEPGIIERLGLGRFLTPAGRIVVRNLARRKMKAMFSVLGLAMAVSILVVGGYNFDAIDNLLRMQFGAAQREDATVSFIITRPLEAAHEIAALPGVLRVEPFRTVPIRISRAHRSKRMALIGIPRDGTLRRLVDAGMRPVELPEEGIVLTSYLAERLEVKPGDLLTIEVLDESRPTRQIPLAGIVEEPLGMNAYMNLDALNRMMDEGRSISGAFLLIDENQQGALYSRLKQIPGVAGVAISDIVLATFLETIGESMWVMNVFIIGFACAIAVGVVYNSARIALSERGRELASLRVLGFTRGEVSAMLLGEQAVLTASSIPIGYAIGYGFAALLSRAYQTDVYRFPLIISNRTWAASFAVIAVAAVLSGILVNRRIRTLDLVEVLKTRE
jgi:putative ABC transport system permease protein